MSLSREYKRSKARFKAKTAKYGRYSTRSPKMWSRARKANRSFKRR